MSLYNFFGLNFHSLALIGKRALGCVPRELSVEPLEVILFNEKLRLWLEPRKNRSSLYYIETQTFKLTKLHNSFMGVLPLLQKKQKKNRLRHIHRELFQTHRINNCTHLISEPPPPIRAPRLIPLLNMTHCSSDPRPSTLHDRWWHKQKWS